MFNVQSYQDWRGVASRLLRNEIPPTGVEWTGSGDEQQLLFHQPPAELSNNAPPILISKSFLDLAQTVARHSDPARWVVLYRVAWRLTHGERHLLQVDIDSDVAALMAMQKAVEKDIYRMRQFIRFRKVATDEGERFVAWYEPVHNTLDANGRFFAARFGAMRWAILTPQATLTWDLEKLESGPGVSRSQAPAEDELEDLWRLYYRTIFNPARLKLKAMRAQLPVHRWKNLPEAQAIPELVRLSSGRVQDMVDAQPRSALTFIPSNAGLAELREAVRKCGACDLCKRATQPVWGEGNPAARIMLIGEQPGDEEDLAGRPFVGPAGQVLDQALQRASLERPLLYLTNAVRAFKFEERGKRRIHQSPRASDIGTCRPWLIAEIEAVQPSLIVCLGASASQSVLGRSVKIGAERGNVIVIGNRRSLVTYHPSAVLRSRDRAEQEQIFSMLVSDLARAKSIA